VWGGKEWQAHCAQLFALRHSEGFQSVPDRVHGDWGIEGFTDEGVLYQCYAAEEPLSSQQLYEKQRDKMTADLAKLRGNIKEIACLVEPAKVRCWILVVPRTEDKRILKHAALKASELRGALKDLAPDFTIRVLTDADFPRECSVLTSGPSLALPTTGYEDRGVASAAQARVDAVTGLDNKLRKLTTDPRPLRAQIVRHYSTGKQLEDWLRRRSPPLWERWRHATTGLAEGLAPKQLINSYSPKETVSSVLDDLTAAAREAIPGLPSSDANRLAWGTISDWLVECPLDFAEDGGD
jgi:hypothetical protein